MVIKLDGTSGGRGFDRSSSSLTYIIGGVMTLMSAHLVIAALYNYCDKSVLFKLVSFLLSVTLMLAFGFALVNIMRRPVFCYILALFLIYLVIQTASLFNFSYDFKNYVLILMIFIVVFFAISVFR